jgi:DNA-binding MarR family transcriptional regulator
MSPEDMEIQYEILEIAYANYSDSMLHSNEVSRKTIFEALNHVDKKKIDRIVANLNAKKYIEASPSIFDSAPWVNIEITLKGIKYFKSLKKKKLDEKVINLKNKPTIIIDKNYGTIGQTGSGDINITNINQINKSINEIRNLIRINEYMSDHAKEESNNKLNILENSVKNNNADKKNIYKVRDWFKKYTPEIIGSAIAKLIELIFIK